MRKKYKDKSFIETSKQAIKFNIIFEKEDKEKDSKEKIEEEENKITKEKEDEDDDEECSIVVEIFEIGEKNI